MPILKEVYPASWGHIYVEDNKRAGPIPLCMDGARSLAHYLETAAHPRGRELFQTALPEARTNLTRWMLKVSLDTPEPKSWAQRVEDAIEKSWRNSSTF